MALRDDSYAEVPLLCVLDGRGVDPLLAKLREVHGEARADIAPKVKAAMRVTARRVEAAAEMMPATSC
jgi:hypothetical protein